MTNVEQFLPWPREATGPAVVGVLVPPGGQLIGVIGLVEAFDAVNRVQSLRGEPAPYQLEILGVQASTSTASGATLLTRPAEEVDELHTLVVGGDLSAVGCPVDPAVKAVVSRLARVARRLVSVCMGTFVLGELGFLDGRRCTTHWLAVDALHQRFPQALVDPDALYTEDGPLFTSAGATAGVDLALHLIRRDVGLKPALAVARSLVVFAQRPGGQSQFSVALSLRSGMDDRMRELVAQVLQRPAEAHTVDRMAKVVGMSPRNFARVFREQAGETPAAFVARARVEASMRMMAQSDAGLAQIAGDCGFGNESTFRRTFVRVAGVSPSAWRARFGVRHSEPLPR